MVAARHRNQHVRARALPGAERRRVPRGRSLCSSRGHRFFPVLRDQGFDRRSLQSIIFLFWIREFGKPLPPIHPRDGGTTARQVERDFNAALLNRFCVFAPHLESPWLGGGAGTDVVADLDE